MSSHADVDATQCCGTGMIEQVRSGVIGQGAPPTPAGYNPPTNWGLYPLDPSKPTVRKNSSGQYVTYLQDVIYFYAGGAIARDGQFGSQTEGRVRDIQRLFGLIVDGICGSQTWPYMDYLVAVNADE